MKRTRTFIAVEAAPQIRLRAAKLVAQLRPVFPDVKWVVPENLHWTLQFLGDIDDLEIPAVCQAVAAAAAEHEGFILSAVEVGVFPAVERPRILWIGAGQGAEAMIELQREIDQRLSRLGFRGESREFVPHLTIGRFGRTNHGRRVRQELDTLARFDAGEMTVDEVTVFASRLAREGSVYEPLSRAPLAM
jgi:2'-5' RNA ligase